jgi:osmoprotectant transport system permease protein
MSDVIEGVQWLFDPDSWWGANGLAHRIWEHLWYSAMATVLAIAIGLPIGLLIGHTGRGRIFAGGSAGVLRAVPTIGVVILVFRWRPGSVWPVLVALVVLAVPPVMLNAAAGIDSIEPGVRDAARGMGLRGGQVLRQVEIPIALPLILAGMRSAANQVIATATVAGFYALGGLGRFIFTGYGTQRLEVVYGATIMVILLVLLVEAGFALAQRLLVSPGLRVDRRRAREATSWSPVPTPAEGASP